VQVLGVSIYSDELNPAHLGADHVIDSVSAGTSHAHNFYPGKRLYIWLNMRHLPTY